MIKKLTFGTPEQITPSSFCKGFTYNESAISYDVSKIRFAVNARGCHFEFPIAEGENFFGLGLQLKVFNLTGRQLVTRVNADPIKDTGDSHAPVPFFVSNKGYGVYFDTVRYVEFAFGRQKNAPVEKTLKKSVGEVKTSTEDLYAVRETQQGSVVSVQIPTAKGADVYIIEGNTIT